MEQNLANFVKQLAALRYSDENWALGSSSSVGWKIKGMSVVIVSSITSLNG